MKSDDKKNGGVAPRFTKEYKQNLAKKRNAQRIAHMQSLKGKKVKLSLRSANKGEPCSPGPMTVSRPIKQHHVPEPEPPTKPPEPPEQRTLVLADGCFDPHSVREDKKNEREEYRPRQRFQGVTIEPRKTSSEDSYWACSRCGENLEKYVYHTGYLYDDNVRNEQDLEFREYGREIALKKIEGHSCIVSAVPINPEPKDSVSEPIQPPVQPPVEAPSTPIPPVEAPIIKETQAQEPKPQGETTVQMKDLLLDDNNQKNAYKYWLECGKDYDKVRERFGYAKIAQVKIYARLEQQVLPFTPAPLPITPQDKSTYIDSVLPNDVTDNPTEEWVKAHLPSTATMVEAYNAYISSGDIKKAMKILNCRHSSTVSAVFRLFSWPAYRGYKKNTGRLPEPLPTNISNPWPSPAKIIEIYDVYRGHKAGVVQASKKFNLNTHLVYVLFTFAGLRKTHRSGFRSKKIRMTANEYKLLIETISNIGQSLSGINANITELLKTLSQGGK